MHEMTPTSLPTSEWPYLAALLRIGLAVALGLFVGLERERRRKDAGVRTFAFAAMLGCMGGLLGNAFALLSLGLLGVLVAFLNIEKLKRDGDTELTTSAALLVMGFIGVLTGQGHTLTPAAVAVLTAALLAWKERLADFSLGLTESEVRSAVLLAILSFVVYPALPEGAIDSWGLLRPKEAWMTVILIAGIGFANYILLKIYGRNAFELTGFFGGLVNSTVTVTALAQRVGEGQRLAELVYLGTLVATAAMVIRNAILLAILAPGALVFAVPAIALMLLSTVVLVVIARRSASEQRNGNDDLGLSSPFSLSSAIKFGLIFLALQAAGTVAQLWFGRYGFYAVSALGGLISSASTVASAATLAAHGAIPMQTAGVAAVIASITSAMVNLPLIARIARQRPLTRRTSWALGLVVSCGILGAIAEETLLPTFQHNFSTLSQPVHSEPARRAS